MCIYVHVGPHVYVSFLKLSKLYLRVKWIYTTAIHVLWYVDKI